MDLKKTAYLAVAGLLTLSGCGDNAERTPSTAGTASAPVRADKLRVLYGAKHREDGVVLSGEHSGKHWIKWIDPGGTMHLSAAHGMFHDDGRFRVAGDQVCTTWKHIDDGKMSCMRLAKAGPDTYVALDEKGTETTRFRVTTPGAPPEPLE